MTPALEHPVTEHVLYVLVAVVPAVPTWIYGWLAWTGRRRRWVRKPRLVSIPPIFSFHKRSYWPLVQAVMGTTWFIGGVFIGIDALYPALGDALTYPFILLMAVSILLMTWWPEFLRPQWHKDWVARGGDANRETTPLFSPQELHERGELPTGISEKARRRRNQSQK